MSAYGYDARVGYKFKVFTNVHSTVVDVKAFDERAFVDVDLTPQEHLWKHDRDDGQFECDKCHKTCHVPEQFMNRCVDVPNFVLIPPNSFALGESVETFKIPRDVLAVCVGKSSYARAGVIVNVTPLEPCLSADTEVLTRSGWKFMKDVVIGEEILTRNEQGVSEYRAVEKKQVRDYSGELLWFAGRSVDQRTTPDHKLFVHKTKGRPPGRTYETGTVTASTVFGRHNYHFDRQVDWRGDSDPDTLSVAGKNYPAGDFLFFLGCWLGDGSAFKGSDRGYHIKLAVVTKEKKRAAFRQALRHLKIRASERARGFEWYDKGLSLWLQKMGHAKQKYIPRNFLQLSPRLLQRLLDGLMESDGTKSTGTYTTASKRLADDVQELAFKCGKAAIVREVTEDTTFGVFTSYKIRICGVHLSPKMPPRNHKTVPYKGKVYDFTVPNHVFFCRRDGKASWTGNCWQGKVTIEISNTTPLPAKIYAGEGIMQVLFLRSDGHTEVVRHILQGVLEGAAVQGGDTLPFDVRKTFVPEQTCRVSYADKKGRYNHQTGLTLPFVKKEE